MKGFKHEASSFQNSFRLNKMQGVVPLFFFVFLSCLVGIWLSLIGLVHSIIFIVKEEYYHLVAHVLRDWYSDKLLSNWCVLLFTGDGSRHVCPGGCWFAGQVVIECFFGDS